MASHLREKQSFTITCLLLLTLFRFRILTMGLALVVVPFLPASNIFFTVGFVVAERVLYLSSIGSCLITVLGFTLLSKNHLGKKVSDVLIGRKFLFFFASSSLAEITMDRESSFLQNNQPKPSKSNLMGDLV